MKKQDGYIIDTTYPIFFYKEMQPIWLKTVVTFLGFHTTEIDEQFSYLELGCAKGINLLIAAINHPQALFVGVDFNRQHIEQAKQLAEHFKLKNIEFIHADFLEFLEKNKRKFDFIVNHGTFSWVSPVHQQHILDIVASALTDLGIFYLHYMCYPGSANLLAVQKLLNLVDQISHEGTEENIEIGKVLFSDLYKAGAFVNQPQIEGVIKTLKNSSAYLAHEFLTDHWQPLYSVDVHKKVYETTQLSYVGSANPCENMDNISIPLNIQNMIKNVHAPALKEYVKDIARDAKQRIDIFQKNPRKFANKEHFSAIDRIYFQPLLDLPKQGIASFQTPIGQIQAPQELITLIFRCLKKEPFQFSTLLKFREFRENPIFLIETIFLLMNAHYLHPVASWAEQVNIHTVNKFNEQMEKQGISLNIVTECATAL